MLFHFICRAAHHALSFVFLLFMFVLFTSVSFSYAGDIYVTSNGEQKIDPADLNYFFDPEGLSPQQIYQLPEEAWQKTSRMVLSPSKNPHPAWIKMQIINNQPTAVRRLLEIRWANYYEADFYRYQPESGELIHLAAGLNLAPEDISINNASILFPLELEAGEKSEVYIRLNTHFNYLLPVYIWEPDHFSEYQLYHHTFYAFVFGVLSVMLLYNLSLWFFTNDRIYLIYSAYLTCIISFILAASGIGQYIVWKEYLWFKNHAYGLSSSLSFLMAGIFVRRFLELKKYGGWLLKINTSIIIYWSVAFIFYLFSSYLLVGTTEAGAMLTMLAAVITSVYLSCKGNTSARIFTIAWLVVIVGTLLYVLMIRGILPHNNLTQYTQVIGFLIEVVLLSFALAERINRERNLREAAQEQLLALQKKTNEELEQRVSARTEELENLTHRLQQANHELQALSITDALTGLKNRRYFDHILHEEIMRSNRLEQPLTLIICDIDHFKNFNDSHGHLAGDKCLQLTAAVLSHHVKREYDCVARYGGEEFAIILPGVEEGEAQQKADEIRQAVAAQGIATADDCLYITMSFGLVSLTADISTTPESLTAMADQALYQAKHDGRNCVRVWGK